MLVLAILSEAKPFYGADVGRHHGVYPTQVII